MTTEGFIAFILLLIFFWPLCWLPFFLQSCYEPTQRPLYGWPNQAWPPPPGYAPPPAAAYSAPPAQGIPMAHARPAPEAQAPTAAAAPPPVNAPVQAGAKA